MKAYSKANFLKKAWILLSIKEFDICFLTKDVAKISFLIFIRYGLALLCLITVLNNSQTILNLIS